MNNITELTTKEAFQDFIDNAYKGIKPKSQELRTAVHNFNHRDKRSITEGKMTDILLEYGGYTHTWQRPEKEKSKKE